VTTFYCMSTIQDNIDNNNSSFIYQHHQHTVLVHQQCSTTSTIIKNGIINSNNNNNNIYNFQNNSDKVDYDLCGLFKIYFPLERNFENLDIKDSFNNNNNNNTITTDNEKFIPVLDAPMSWSELTDLSESLYSSSSCSSSIDFDELSCSPSNPSSTSTPSSFKVSKKSTTNPSQHSSPPSKGNKKLFIGGITFDDIKDRHDLIELRIKKIKHLLESFGKVIRFDENWDKNYCFVTYINPKITQQVLSSISNQNKKMKLINTIKESLIHENNDPMAAPFNTLYARYPSNNNNKSSSSGSNNRKKK